MREDRAVVRRGKRDEVLDAIESAEPLHIVAAHQPAHAETDEIELSRAELLPRKSVDLRGERLETGLRPVGREVERVDLPALLAEVLRQPLHVALGIGDAVDEEDGIAIWRGLRRGARGTVEKRERGAEPGGEGHAVGCSVGRGRWQRRRKHGRKEVFSIQKYEKSRHTGSLRTKPFKASPTTPSFGYKGPSPSGGTTGALARPSGSWFFPSQGPWAGWVAFGLLTADLFHIYRGAVVVDSKSGVWRGMSASVKSCSNSKSPSTSRWTRLRGSRSTEKLEQERAADEEEVALWPHRRGEQSGIARATRRAR